MRYSLTEIKDTIKDRRTIYPEFYSSRKIHKEIVDELLNVAIWAPSHGKTQPWRFKVYLDKGLENLGNKLSGVYKETSSDKFMEGKNEKFRSRPSMSGAVIQVTMERTQGSRIPEIEEIEACSAAIQNMLLLATAHGIGSFWSSPGFIYSPEFKKEFGLNIDDHCLGFIYLGYPKEQWPKTGQRKPIEYITEYITE